MFEQLRDLVPGVDRFPASYIPIIREGLERRIDGPGIMEAVGGWSISRQRATQFRWGKLDTTLNAGSTATVSLWCSTDGHWSGWDVDSGANWDECYAPPTMNDDLPTESWVQVAIINGRKIVVQGFAAAGGSDITVMTDFQVDAANKKLQKKTRTITVVADTESGWTDIHTGTACS